HEQSDTGEIERQIANLNRGPWYGAPLGGPIVYSPSPAFAPGAAPVPSPQPYMARPMMATSTAPIRQSAMPAPAGIARAITGAVVQKGKQEVSAVETSKVSTPSATPALTKMRLQFPEIIYNNIIKVQEQTSVEIKLGDSM